MLKFLNNNFFEVMLKLLLNKIIEEVKLKLLLYNKITEEVMLKLLLYN